MGRPLKFETADAVDKAMDLFWSQGYAATTPQQLAGRMGIGKGSLYNTFESKHTLFVRALEQYSLMRLHYLTDLFAPDGEVAPRLKEAAVVLSGIGEHQRGCVMVNAAAELGASDSEVSRIADHLFAGIASAFARAIAQGRENGELVGSEAPQVAANRLLALVVGLSVLARSGALTSDGLGVIDGLVDTF